MFSSINIIPTNTVLTSPKDITYRCSTSVLEINPKIPKTQQVLINHNPNIEQVNIPPIENFSSVFRKNNIIQKILRKYWMEYVYISSYNPRSSSFESIISKNYLSANINLIKDNLTYLRQNLLKKNIEISYLSNFNILNTLSPMKYVYKKQPYLFLTKLYNNQYRNNLQNQSQHQLFQQLKEQKFPVFILVNGMNQMIMGQPEYTLKISQKFHLPYKYPILRKDYKLPLREGYIFINLKDAVEYYDYIKSKYTRSSQQLKLKIFVGNLYEYYKKNRHSLKYRHTQFRLFPDLTEIGQLVSRYQYYSNLSFNSNQKYGKNYFQGQPIYYMEPILSTYVNKITGKTSKDYFPKLSDLQEKSHSLIFTTYQAALFSWKQYQQKFLEYSLPKKPQLQVYNMENFLKEYEYQKKLIGSKRIVFRFIPSHETYNYIKSMKIKKNKIFFQRINENNSLILLVRVWIDRVLWGMLRWYPPEK